ncbi:MAG: pyruvate dehydrogenase complex E1 component subunit beta [Deltaproteobacteria bacterium]|nr:pyruvate dehydrogenase complex E1 component subunit beta [Deltaproteobacteria bacterium]MCX7952358.1 pyruvate dehydrogenase complex E1 component subunit beta [Deltaproteobacteria bacterium]
MAVIQIREAIRDALAEEMRRDEKVILLGEEVGEYDGAYKCSRGLLKEFGPDRVIDTPIAENGFAGLGIGMAFLGFRPVVEFMTFNFSLIAIDQIINTAAKARLMSGGQLTCPIVFRGAGGAAKQLAAQHSNSFEHFYAYTPGLYVVAPSTPYDMKGLLKTAIRDDNIVCFFESELTYSLRGEVPDEEYLIPLGKGDIKKEGKDVTLISWSKNVHLALKVAEELEQDNIDAEVVDLRSLRPLDKDLIFGSVRKTNRVVVIQEQHEISSYGSYLAYLIQKDCFDYLDAPVEVVSSLEVPMPYSLSLEEIVFPSVARCKEAVYSVCYL